MAEDRVALEKLLARAQGRLEEVVKDIERCNRTLREGKNEMALGVATRSIQTFNIRKRNVEREIESLRERLKEVGVEVAQG